MYVECFQQTPESHHRLLQPCSCLKYFQVVCHCMQAAKFYLHIRVQVSIYIYIYTHTINHNHPYPRSLRAVEFVTDGFCAFHVGNLPHPVACFQPHTAAPSGGPMGSESQPKCSDPNRFPKMAAFLLQFARSSVPDEWLLRLTFCCFYIMETQWPPWTFADQVGRVWHMENCDPERGKCMGCCVVSLWTSIHMVPGVCCWTSYLSLLKPRLFDFFGGFIQNLMFYWFLIYLVSYLCGSSSSCGGMSLNRTAFEDLWRQWPCWSTPWNSRSTEDRWLGGNPIFVLVASEQNLSPIEMDPTHPNDNRWTRESRESKFFSDL